jgi:hypothetical protein
MRRNVYLHFINRDARDILGLFRHLSRDTHCKILSRALNAAVILCEDHTVMPPGFFLECELAYDVVSNKTPFERIVARHSNYVDPALNSFRLKPSD